jgi:Sec-independent protein translocase protein TatA
MDWTQVIVAGIVTLPATVGSIGAFILAMRSNRKIDDNTEKTVTAANALSKQNVQQSKELVEVKEAAQEIKKAVNGELDARFKRIEDAIAAISKKLDQ